MEVQTAIDRLNSTDKTSYSKGEVKQILDTITPDRMLLSVDKVMVGDVFYYKLVGGKVRPWVCLWSKRGLLGAASITHSDLIGGYESKCRFYKGSYIGPTLTIIEELRVLDAVTTPYSNKKHLSEVKKQISSIWG